MRAKKIPGPDHPIAIEDNNGRVIVVFNGKTIADSGRALVLRETTYAPVFYIPREDAEMASLTRTDHSTYCPYKGDAAYYTITVDGKTAENAVWTYEDPFEAVAAIEDRLAFYASKVDAIDVGQG